MQVARPRPRWAAGRTGVVSVGRVLLALCLGLAVGLVAAAPSGPPVAVLRVGKISDDPQRDLGGLRPLLDYLTARLAGDGIDRIEVVMAREVGQMVRFLREGQVDWVTETVGMATILEQRTGARIVMNRWKYGEREYRATVFVRDSSAVRSLADLTGSSIAFEHPGSTTGFMVPALDLHRQGLRLVELPSPRSSPPADAVGYFFSGDEINTSTWVHKGLAEAGALSSTDWTRSFQVPEALQASLRIIHEGERLPRAVEVLRSGVEPALEARLVEVLTTAHENEAGRAALAAFQGTTRLERYEPADWPYVAQFAAALPDLLDVIR